MGSQFRTPKSEPCRYPHDYRFSKNPYLYLLIIIFKISFCLLRVYDYSDFIALRLYDSLSTVACPPSSTLVESIFWPQFDLDLISRIFLTFPFSRGIFYFSLAPIDLETSLNESLDMMSHKSQKPLFFSFHFFSSSPSSREKKKLRNQKQKRNSEPWQEIRKRAMSHTRFGSLSEYIERVRNRAERKKN